MNKIFKVIWSKSKQCYIVVSEIAKNKTGKKKIVVASILAALAMQSGLVTEVMAADPPSARLADAAEAVGTNGVAIGSSARSKSNQSVAIGYFSVAQAPGASPENPATAVGAGANANGAGTVALGLSANATGANAVALGGGSNGGKNKTEATAVETTAVGFNAKASNSRATAIGSGAASSGSDAIAFGTSTVANSEKAIAIGANSKASDIGATALGRDTEASGASATALGALASAKGSTATAVGMEASATGNESLAIGKKASATSGRALAVGTNTTATGASSVAVGSGAGGSGIIGFAGSLNSTAGVVNTNRTINYATTAEGDNAVALGFYANAKNSGVAVGQKALAATGGVAIGKGVLEDTGNNYAGGVVIGQDSATLGPYSLAMGFNAFASGSTSMAIGHTVSADGGYAVAMGRKVSASGTSTAIGHHATATNGGLAIGSQENDASNDRTTASAKGAVAIGKNTKATSEDAVAIGTNAQATRLNSVALGSGSTTATGATNQGSATINGITYNFAGATGNPNMQVSVGNTGATRQIKNVAAGEVSATSTDAINGSQLYAVASAVKPLKYVSINSTATGTGSNVDNDGAQAPNSIAIGPSSTVTKQNSIAFGNNAQSLSDDSITIGRNAKAESGPAFTTTSRAIAIGANSKVATNVTQGIAIGSGSLTDEGAVVTGDQSIAIGGNVKVDGHAAIAIGGDDARKAAGQQVSYTNTNDNEVTGTLQTAILNLTGYNLSNYKGTAASHAGVAYGTSALAGNAGVAIGTASDSMTRMNDKGQVVNNKPVTNAVAIGTGARANFDNSVAIGGGSNTDHYATKQVNAVIDGVEVKWSGGENISPGDVVSFGAKGFERQLKNVAPGEVSQTSTDAVNGSQIYSLARKVTNIMNGGSGSVVNVNATGEPLSKVVTGTGASKVEKYYRTVDVKDDGTLVTGAVAQTPTSLALVNVDQTDTNKQTQTPRILGNVANGVKDNDAVNVSQLNAAKVKYFSVNSSDAGNINNDGATGTDAIAIGPSAVSNAVGSVALGKDAKANGDFTVALGGGNWQFKGAQANGVGTTALGSSTKTKVGTNYQTAIGFGATTSAESALALGYNAAASAQNAIALGRSASTAGQDAVALGSSSQAKGDSGLAIGNGAQANSNSVISLGYQANNGASNNTYGVAIGWASGMQSNGLNNVGVGTNAGRQVIGNNNTSLGNGAGNIANTKIYTSESIMLGTGAKVVGSSATKSIDNVIAIGKNTSGSASSAIAVGINAGSSAENGVAIGPNSNTSAYNGIALGSFSEASTKASVSGYNVNTNRTDKYAGLTDIALTSKLGAVSVGNSTMTRQITGVAAGTNDTDAVNIAQLKSVNLAFTGNTGSGDVNLANSKLSINGDNTYIKTAANGKQLTISPNVQNITLNNGRASASTGLADASNVAQAINNVVSGVQLDIIANKGTKTGSVNLSNQKLTVTGGNGIRTDIYSNTSGQNLVIGLEPELVKATTQGIALSGDSGSTGLKYLKDGDAVFKVYGDGNLVTTAGSAAGVKVSVDSTKVKDLAVEAVTVSKANTVDNPITVTSTTGNNSKEYAIGIDTTKLAAKTNLAYTANGGTAKTVSLAKGLNFVDGANTVATVDSDGKVSFDINKDTKDSINKSATAVGRTITLNADSGTGSSQSLSNGNVSFAVSGATGDYISTTMDGSAVKVSTKRATIDSDANTGKASVTGADGLATAKNVASAINSAVNGLSQNLNISDGTKDSSVALKNQKLTVTGTGAAKATVNNQTITIDVAEGTLTPNTTNGTVTGTTGVAKATEVAAAINNTNTVLGNKIATNTTNIAHTIALADDKGTSTTAKSLKDGNISFNIKGDSKFISTAASGNDVTLTVNEQAIKDAAKSASSFKVKANAHAEEEVKGGDTITFNNGDNIEISQAGKTFTIKTAKNMTVDSLTAGNTVINTTGLTSGTGASAVSFGTNGISAGNQVISNVASGGTTDTNAANIGDVKQAVANLSQNLNITDGTSNGTVDLKNQKLNVAGANGVTANVNNQTITVGLDANTVNATTKGIGLTGDTGSTGNQYLKNGDVSFAVTGDGNLVSTSATTAGVKVAVDAAKVKDLAVAAVTVSKDGQADNPITVTPTAGTNSKDYAIGIDTTKLAAKTDLTYRANSAADANAKKVSLSKGLNFVDGGSTVATVDNDGKVSFDLNTATKNQINTNTTDIAANKGNITKNTAAIATNTAALARNISLGADAGTASSQSLSAADVAFNVKGATGDFVSTNMNGNTVEISTKRATINSNATTGEASVTGNDGLATAQNVADAINKAADAAKAGAAWNITTNSSTTDKTAVKGGDTVDLVNGDNIEITQDGTDKKKITVATKKDITVDSVTANNKVTVGSGANKITLDGTDGSVTGKAFTGTTFTGTSFTGTSFTAGNTVINTNGLTNGTTAITGTGVTTDNVTVGDISIDKTAGINAGNKVISNVASGGTTLTNAANIGDVQNAVANLSQNLNITDGTHDGTVDLKNQKLNVAGANGVTATVNNQTITVGLDANTVNATTKGIGLTADTGSTGNKYLKDGDVSFAVTGDGSLVSTSATAAGVKVAVNSASITAGTDGTITGPTTDGVATAKNVADAINAAKKASKTEITANTGEAANATTGNVTLTSTTAADGHTIYDVKLNDKVTFGTGANAVTIDGTTGAITGKTANIGGVTVNGTANTIGGLSNTTWNGTAVSGRAATEDQLKAATGATTLKVTGDVATNTGSINLKDDTFGIKGDGKYISTDVNGKNVNLTVSEAEVKKSAVAAVTVSTDTTDTNNPLTVTPTASADGTTKDYKVTIDGTKIANKTNLSYKANNGTAKQVSLADGLDFTNGTLTTASIDDNGVVKYDVNTATITAGTDGTITGPTTDGVATAKNVTDAINAAKKASKTEITANTGEAANATTGNVTLTSTTAADGHTIYDVKLNDKVTLGSGTNAVTVDGTAAKVTAGVTTVDGATGTITTGGTNSIKVDGATGTVTGLTNKDWTPGVTKAVTGRAATEDQLQKVADAASSQTWNITADKAGTTGAQTGTKKNATVGKDETVELVAGDNLTINQNERKFTYSLNKDLANLTSVSVGTGTTETIKLDGATGKITAKNASIGGVTIDGDNNHVTGLSNTTWNGTATAGRAATEDQLKAVADTAKTTTDAVNLKFSGDTNTSPGVVNLKDDTLGIIGDGKYVSTDANGKNLTVKVSEAEVKKSAVAAVTVSTDTTDANNPLTVTPTASADGTTKDYKVTIDGTKIANKTNLSYKANDGTAKQVSLADGLNFKNGTLTTASIDDNGVVKYDVNTAAITAGTDGTITGPTTDGVATAKNVADAINAAKKASKTEITANTGEAANATTGNVTLTSTTAADGHTIYDVKLNDKVTLGSGANAVTIDGTTGAITGKTANIGGVTVNGTANTIGGLSNTTWNGTVTTGRAATEDQLKAVADAAGSQTWEITAGKKAGTSGAQTGTKENAKVGKDDKVSLIAGENLTVDQSGKNFTYSLNTDLVKMNSATFLGTGTNTTVMTGDSITQTAGTQTNTSTAAGNTVADGTKSTETTADGQVIKDGTKINTSTVDENTIVDGARSNKTTVASNVIDDGNGNVNTSNATSNTITDGTNTSAITAGKGQIGSVGIDGIASKITTGGANAVVINGADGTIKTGTVTVTGGTTNDITGLSNTTVTAADFATKGRAATEEQLKAATGATTLKFTGDVATNTGSVNLKDDTFGIKGDGKYISTDVNGKNVNLTVSEAEVKKSAVAAVTVSTDTTDANNPISVTPTTSADGTTKDYKVTIDSTKIANKTNLSYKANDGTPKQVSLADGLNFKNGTLTTASIDDNGVVKYDVNTASITAGADGTITGPTTDGVATAQNVADAINAAKKASKTEITANTGEAANATTGNVTLTSTTAADGHTIYDVKLNDKVTLGSGANAVTIDGTAGKATIGSSIVDGVNNTFTTGGASPVTLNGATGTITGKTANIGGVTVDGTNNHVMGLANKDWTPGVTQAVSGRAATEDQLQKVSDAVGAGWKVNTGKVTGSTGESNGAASTKVASGEEVQFQAGNNLVVDQNGKTVAYSLNKALKDLESATFNGTGTNKTVINGDSITQTAGTQTNTSTAGGNTVADGTKSTETTADGQVIKDGAKSNKSTVDSNVIDDGNGKVNTSNAISNTITDGTNTSTIIAGKATIGSSIVDGVNNTFTTGGANAVKLDGVAGTIKTGTVTVTGGTTNDITGLSNTTVTAADFATKGRAATEEQLKAVGEQTWQITADKDTATSGAQTGTKKDAKVGKDDKVQLIAGENLTVNQNERDFTYSLNKNLVKMNSATFEATGGKTTVIKGDSIVQTDGTKVNTSTAGGNTVADGTKSTATTVDGTTVTSANGNTKYAADGVHINTTGKTPVSLTDAGLDNGNNVIKNVASGHVNNDATDNTNAANIADVKKATTTVTANAGEAANATTGNVTLTSTTAADGHTIYDVKLNDKVTLGTGANAVTIDGTAGKSTIGSSVIDGVNNTFTTGGANAVKLDGTTGTIKTGTVTVTGGTTNDITGLSNTTITAADFATKGRAATEEQLKAVGEQTWQITADKDATTSGAQTGTKKDAKVGKDDKVQLIAGENMTVNQNERDFTFTLNKDLVKMNSATFEATGGKTTVIKGDSIVQTDGTKVNTSTAGGNTVADGTKSTETTADGQVIKDGAKTNTSTVDENTIVDGTKSNKSTVDGNTITDGTNTTATTSSSVTVKDNAGNSTVITKDNITTGVGGNKITLDGTAGKATIGSSIVDGVNNTFTTGGANAVKLDGVAGTIKTGTVTVTGGTTNDITGLSNTTVNSADFATKGRAATEEQLKAVGEQTWQITADKDATTSGAQTGTKKDAKVGKDDKVQLIAGENMTVNQNERDFTFTLNKDLVKMNSATFLGTGTNKTVITGDSITQTAGTQTNTSTAAGNTVANGTKSTETTAAGQVIKDGAKTNTSTVDENTIVDGTKSNKSTVDGNTITDGTNTTATTSSSVTVKDNAGNSTVITKDNITTGVGGNKITLDGTAGKATVGASVVDGVNNTFTTGGANAVKLDGAAGTIKTGTVTVTGGTTNDITGLSNTTVNSADFATKGRAATEEQLKAVGEQTWQITADKDATTSGAQTGTKKDAKVGKDDKVQLIAGENMTVNQNERDFTFTLNKDLVKMNSATFLGTGSNTTVITGNSITQTAGAQTNTSTAAGNTIANGTKSTETTADGQVIKDGAKSNKSTVDSNVIDDGNGNVNTSNATSNTITDGTNTSTITAGKANIGNIAVDGVNNKITMGNGASPVTLDGANGHLDGLTNTTWVPGVTKATTGRAATEDQLQQVSDAVGAGWKVNTGTVAGSSGVSNGAASTKVSSGEEVKLQAGDNLVIDQNGKTVSYSLNKDLTKMNSATFEATGGKTTVVKGDSIVQTDGGKTNTSNAAGNTVVDGNKSTATTAAGTTITDGAKTNTSTADKNVIDDGAGNKSTFTKDGITITKTGKDTVSLTSNGLDNGKNKIVNVAAGVANTDAVNVGQLKEYAAKSTTELTANGGQPAGSTTGNIVLTKTTAADGHTIYDNKLNDKITLGTDPTKAVTVDGTTGTVTGLTNKTWTPGSIVSGRAATEDQLKEAVADSGWKAAVDKEGSGQSTVVGTSPEKIKAEETVTFKAGNNMMVTQTGKSISYAVNPELTDMKSATFKDAAGNTTVTNGNGITITPGSANPTNPHAGPVSLTKDGLNNGNNQIKGVAPGTDPTDAVNVSQLNASNANTSQAINQIAGEVQHVGAHAAAMAALKPIQYDPLEPTQVMAGVGNYRGETAAALGLAHYTNENTMFNVGVSVGGNHNMVNAGVTHKFGYSPEKKNIPDRYKAGPISSVYVMQDEVSSLKKENAEQKYVIADQAARLTTLEAENEQQRRELAETKKGLDDLKAAVDKLLASKG
ncbi:YadA-like family protein [Veillonella atypica]|uniref:YadA-like family protein n=3 Tax=Veillonella TaxID=29465 RepID=UPI0024919851|nr:ESPR-type extended signal peptide-containing protein [Veillonella atypica]